MSSTVAPYGTWKTPLTPEAIVKGANLITDIFTDPITAQVFHIEMRPSEKGRNVIVNSFALKDVHVGKDVNVRNKVHEYGGGFVAAYDGVIYYSNFEDGRIYRKSVDNGRESVEPEPVTPESEVFRFADFRVHPAKRHYLIAVLEDHTQPHPKNVTNTLVIIDTRSKTIAPLNKEADFYACPRFSPDGRKLAYQQWFHPDMSWEGAEVIIANLDTSDTISIISSKTVAGKKLEISAGYPEWLSNDKVVLETDESGFQNPYIVDASSGMKTPVCESPLKEEFSEVAWIFGVSHRAILNGGHHILYSTFKDGKSTLRLVKVGTDGTLKEDRLLDQPFTLIESLQHVPNTRSDVVFLGATPTRSKSIYRATIDLEAGEVKYENLKPTSDKFQSDYISSPRSYVLRSEDDPLHVVVYMPKSPDFVGPTDEKPPAIVWVHGGPTYMEPQSLQWDKQYFTSQGFAWIDVNYGGSSGYGRAYTSKLEGKWGVTDVEDCILASKLLSDPSGPYALVDPKRMFIRGSSSGGFAVLGAASLVSNEDLTVFAGGTSLYGIADLTALVADMHKFESLYLTKLLGGVPAAMGETDVLPICEERSPLRKADRIKIPLLLLQGDVDRVVPKEQSKMILDSIQSRGGNAQMVVYEGEGHGFRQEANMKDALEKELAFYKGILKL